jgi:hypothetical protein
MNGAYSRASTRGRRPTVRRSSPSALGSSWQGERRLNLAALTHSRAPQKDRLSIGTPSLRRSEVSGLIRRGIQTEEAAMTSFTGPIVACALFAATAGCSSNESYNASADDNPSEVQGVLLTVKALQVTSSAPRVLSGAFEIRPPNAGELSINSNGFGGACLLAQLPVRPKQCTTDRQCDVVFGHGERKWGGYCVDGSCWVKPSEGYCTKGVGPGPHSTPAKDVSEVYSYASTSGQPASPIKWRVLGCLNGVAVSANSNARPPCPGGPGELIHDPGEPTDVL